MREKLEKIRALIDEILGEMGAENPPEIIVPPEPQPQVAPAVAERAEDWAEVERLLKSDDWPHAVFAVQIADDNSERDKEERAEGISDIILPPLKGKRFLDFGCGEGHVAKHVAKEAALSVGYDVSHSHKSNFVWEEAQGAGLLTSDFGRVKEMGPYDAVLMYDVLDHAVGDSPSELLSKAASVLSDGGRIYMRCHPWCGRHGGHLYRKINKAFVHLVLTDEELRACGVEPEHNLRVLKPLWLYSEAIKAAGLVGEGEPEIDSQEVEDFFKDTPVLKKRILRHWGASEWDHDPPSFQMSQCFIDYVLKKK